VAVTSANGAAVLHNAGIEVRIVDPKRVLSFALSAGPLVAPVIENDGNF
jgi:hypothetical protein